MPLPTLPLFQANFTCSQAVKLSTDGCNPTTDTFRGMPTPLPSPSVALNKRPSVSVAVQVLLAKPLVKIKLLFMLASFISLVLSVSLYFNGHEQQGIYVGIWVPSILSLGSLLLAGERGE
jgi:hypothetical protein